MSSLSAGDAEAGPPDHFCRRGVLRVGWSKDCRFCSGVEGETSENKYGPLKPTFGLEFVDNGIVIRDGTSVTVQRLPMEGPEAILTVFWTKVGKYDLILRPKR